MGEKRLVRPLCISASVSGRPWMASKVKIAWATPGRAKGRGFVRRDLVALSTPRVWQGSPATSGLFAIEQPPSSPNVLDQFGSSSIERSASARAAGSSSRTALHQSKSRSQVRRATAPSLSDPRRRRSSGGRERRCLALPDLGSSLGRILLPKGLTGLLDRASLCLMARSRWIRWFLPVAASSAKRRNGLLRALILALVFGGALLAGETTTGVRTAKAATAGCGTAQARFVGRTFDPSGYEPWGAQANITRRVHPDLCTSGAATDSSVWAMLAGDGPTSQYAQIGFIYANYLSTPLEFFWEYSKCSGCAFGQHFWGQPGLDVQKNYKVLRFASDGHLHMILDNTQAPCDATYGCAETPFDPLNAWPGTNSEWYSETQHPGDDVFGLAGTGNLTDVNAIQTYQPNGPWVNQNYTGGPTACYLNITEITSNSHFRSWTAPLDHSC
jgi:hypothetical protein